MEGNCEYVTCIICKQIKKNNAFWLPKLCFKLNFDGSLEPIFNKYKPTKVEIHIDIQSMTQSVFEIFNVIRIQIKY